MTQDWIRRLRNKTSAAIAGLCWSDKALITQLQQAKAPHVESCRSRWASPLSPQVPVAEILWVVIKKNFREPEATRFIDLTGCICNVMSLLTGLINLSQCPALDVLRVCRCQGQDNRSTFRFSGEAISILKTEHGPCCIYNKHPSSRVL